MTRLLLQLATAQLLAAAIVAPPTLKTGRSQKGFAMVASLPASGSEIPPVAPGPGGVFPCGDQGDDFTKNSFQVLQAFQYASGKCCALGEDCSSSKEYLPTQFPSGCTRGCATAIAVVRTSCGTYLAGGIGRFAFEPALAQAENACVQRGPPVCHDEPAHNFLGSLGAKHATASATNTACRYTCAAFIKHYGLPASSTRCYIQDAVAARVVGSEVVSPNSWPPPINTIWDTGLGNEAQQTFTVLRSENTAVVIQGHADQPGRGTELGRRVDVVGQGLVMVLRHVSSSNRMAVAQTSSCLYQECYVGGALYGYQSTVIVEHSVFQSNTAVDGGGAIYMRMGESLKVSDSSFDRNSAEQPGGAVGLGYQKESQFTRSNFTSNTAGRGGAIYVGTAQPFRTFSVTSCSGGGNIANDKPMSGCGALFWFGAGADCDDTALEVNSMPQDSPVASWSEISLTSVRLTDTLHCQMSLPDNVDIGTCKEQQATMNLNPVIVPGDPGVTPVPVGPFNGGSNAMWGMQVTAIAIPAEGCAMTLAAGVVVENDPTVCILSAGVFGHAGSCGVSGGGATPGTCTYRAAHGCTLSCPAGMTVEAIGADTEEEALQAVCSITGAAAGEATYLAQWHGDCVTGKR